MFMHIYCNSSFANGCMGGGSDKMYLTFCFCGTIFLIGNIKAIDENYCFFRIKYGKKFQDKNFEKYS